MPLLKSLLSCALLCLLQSIAQGQLSADFSASRYSGCSPIIINFSDLSKGSPQTYQWTVSDASLNILTTSTAQNFATKFSKEGSYDVKLTVTNGSQTDVVIKKIIVYAKPAASFSADILSGCYPFNVNFRDSSTISQGAITNHEWDLGDGKSSLSVNPSHMFTTAGNFNVSLKITSDKGCTDVVSKSNLVQIDKGVLANFSVTPLSVTCKYPEDVSFQNKSTGTGTLKYVWDFGTGDSAHSTNGSHTYTYPGSYDVTLHVSNDAGCTDSLMIKNAVTVGAANAAFISAPNVCVGAPLSIQNVSTPGTVSSHWNFSDNTTSDVTSPVKVFNSPGTYGIQLINTFSNCIDTATYSVIVKPGPVVAFSTADTSDCRTPSSFAFMNATQNAVSYLWDFGNGTSASLTNPTGIFTDPGTYTIKLVATNAEGCKDSLTKANYIHVYLPTADQITGAPYAGCAPYNHVFKPVLSNIFPGDAVTSYAWDFGNGILSSAAQPSVTYSNPGIYTIKLAISTARGCTARFVFDSTIRIPHKPVAAFTATPDSTCGPGPIVFVNQTQSVDSVTKWTWLPGEAFVSHLQTPDPYGYDNIGDFYPVLIADAGGCADTARVGPIKIRGQIAHFAIGAANRCTQPFVRTFTDYSVGGSIVPALNQISEWKWEFDNGNSYTYQVYANRNPPAQTFSPGTHTASLTITGKNCNQRNVVSFRILDTVANFSYPQQLCRLDSAVFTITGILPEDARSFTWTFGDGTTKQTDRTQLRIAHQYASTGSYNVSLVVFDTLNCTKTISHLLYVNEPLARFKSSGSCASSNISFTDLSTPSNGNSIQQYQWHFGDSSTDLVTNSSAVIHQFQSGGTFQASLKVTDSKGCTDSARLPVYISAPVAGFTLQDSVYCPRYGVGFANTSTGTSLNGLWNFGDATTSTAQNPVHAYGSAGVYTVSLQVRDTLGCISTRTKNNVVTIATPAAKFNMDTAFSRCPPLKVLFTNASSFSNSAQWTFGDGNAISQLPDSVSHIYNTPGIFFPTLKAFGNGGCFSIYKRDSVVIKGPYGVFSYDPPAACAGVNSISFHVSNPSDVAVYNWDFGGKNGLVQTTNPDIKHVFDSAMSFVPFVILQNSQGCQFRLDGNTPIKIQDLTARISKLQTDLFCGSAQIAFQDSSSSVNDNPVSWQWNFGDGTTSVNKNPSHHFGQPGIYPVSLVVATDNGCRDTTVLPIPVTVVVQPVITISGDSTGCTPASLHFTGNLLTSDTSQVNWQWNFGNGQVSTLQDPPTQVYSTGTNYLVSATVTNSSGCTAVAGRPITIHTSPVVDAGTDKIVCYGDSLKLTATGASTYIWNADSTLSCATCPTTLVHPVVNTVYHVTGKDGFGCAGSDSVAATVQQPYTLVVTPIRDTLCIGETVRFHASGTDLYHWSPATNLSNPDVASPVASPASTITYTITSRDTNNCFPQTKQVVLVVYPIPKVTITTKDVLVEVGSRRQLTADVSSDVTDYLWTPANTLSCATCPAPFAVPSFKTTYTLQASNPGHCVMTDTITLFTTCNKNSNLFIPNTFSPNNDGVNERFIIQGHGINTLRSVTIFNRWGQIVFQRRNIPCNSEADSWDGTFNGNKPVADVYTYMVEIVCDNNQILHYQGNVNLIR